MAPSRARCRRYGWPRRRDYSRNKVWISTWFTSPAGRAVSCRSSAAVCNSSINRLEHAIMVQKNIDDVEQLRGKVLGISTVGSLTDILMREGLRLNGLSEKDVTILPLGDEAARLIGLKTGRVQGAI